MYNKAKPAGQFKGKGPELVGGVKLAAIAKNGNEYVQLYLDLSKLGIGEGTLFINGKINPDGNTVRLFLPDDMNRAIKLNDAKPAARAATPTTRKPVVAAKAEADTDTEETPF